METYKQSLKTRVVLLRLLALLPISFVIYDQLLASEALHDSAVYGFQLGLVIGLELAAIFFMIRFSRILHDDTKLKAQYNREHDERLKAIRARSGMPMLLILPRYAWWLRASSRGTLTRSYFLHWRLPPWVNC